MNIKKVYLVGAGPGDPELITLKAQRVLKQADVILYDRLVNKEILSFCSKFSLKVYVGKFPEKQLSSRQDFINQQLIHYAKKGLQVVRLKGGDPVVFGRGSEEALALKKANIEFEFIPGISSAIAVPELCNIPVTHRNEATAFAVFSGHSANDDQSFDIDWTVAARIPTSVFLMGLKHLPQIIDCMVAFGKNKTTPIAVIEKGSTEQQNIVVGTLENILNQTQSMTSPVTIIIGPTVKYHEILSEQTLLNPINKTEIVWGLSV